MCRACCLWCRAGAGLIGAGSDKHSNANSEALWHEQLRWHSHVGSALLLVAGDNAARQAGKVLLDDTAAIHCQHCGPVYVHPSIAVVLPVVDGWPCALGCPWCVVHKTGGYMFPAHKHRCDYFHLSREAQRHTFADIKRNLGGTPEVGILWLPMGTLSLTTITLNATRPHYGGVPWWFRCGVTGKRAHKLYLFPGQMRFCHRTGLDLNPIYLSQRVTGMDKVLRRLWSLRQSVPSQGSILEPLKRPPRMHLRTYVKLLRRDAAIWSSPNNPLPALLRRLGISELESRDDSHII